MRTWFGIWLVLRVMRWLSWVGFFGYSFYFLVDRESHLDAYGHLLPTTEMALFGFGIAAALVGFLELMVREKAGLPRPDFLRIPRPNSR
jgi:purine-cytosine permease-like protein